MRNIGKFAQHYHITPEQGLLNDPNGLSYFDGYYHVFYQYNPHKTDHSVKYWGHVRSKDLVHWEQLPISLKSDDWFDKDGVYSGGAWVHEGELYLFYTGNTKDENGVRTSYQCLATSKDGIHFEKQGPILEQAPGFTGHVRDPKVWFDTERQGWWMILGAQREDETGDTIAYFSTDLKNWEYTGSIFQFDEPFGYMWECPDIVFLCDEVTGEDKAVFIFSPQGIEPQGVAYQNIFNTVYLVGQWDSASGKFIPDNPSIEALVECDHGFEYYAPQTFVDPQGRVIQYAWMGTMEPDVEASVPTIADNWLHHLSMPKTLHLVNGKLVQRSLSEMTQLVVNETTYSISGERQQVSLAGPSWIEYRVGDVVDDVVLMVDDACQIMYNQTTQLMKVSRTNWLTKEVEYREWYLEESLEQFDLWLDSSSIELLINDGKFAFSQRVFAESPLSKLEVAATSGQLTIRSLSSYQFD
ncbi:glycoside hydrolase family 32 protein [Aerococcaceae bacterium zg-B36]|uniref:glycoside hydrolase family 32 protein n=1 Tax=Aerococcaceae bacterium zg-252 TaxID=2796928 RepID=UPI001BD8E6B1|nr:glycoside hydrolase family 32 protein [Aerococcaceae bacterium zg-B36]